MNLELWCNGTERENSKCLKKNLVPLPWNALVSNKVIRGDNPANNNVKHERAWFILDNPNN